MTVSAAAEALRISPQATRRLLERGTLHGERGPRAWRVCASPSPHERTTDHVSTDRGSGRTRGGPRRPRQTRPRVQEAATAAAALRAKLKAGGRGSAEITAADLAAADQAAEFAALAHEGAKVESTLAEAVKTADSRQPLAMKSCQTCHSWARDVVFALQAVEAVLSPLVAAAERYDTFVESAVQRLEKVAPPAAAPQHEAGAGLTTYRRGGTLESPFVGGGATQKCRARTRASRTLALQVPTSPGRRPVDGVALTSCRGPGGLRVRVFFPP